MPHLAAQHSRADPGGMNIEEPVLPLTYTEQES